MAINLIRNSRVFFTTNLDSNNRVRLGTVGGTNLYTNGTPVAFTASNTYELQVLEGMSFSQSTAQDTVTLNEAGASPARGQRSFNTALQPADFTFSTYIRPQNTGSAQTAEEKYLWNAFASATSTGGWTDGANATTAATLSFANSDKHQLQAFGLIIVFSDGAYVIDNCALDTATIDFGLDAIGAIQWAGKGTQVRALENFGVDPAVATPSFIGADISTGVTTETVPVVFASLASGDTSIVAGLTFTATATVTATQHATLWANIGSGTLAASMPTTYGTWTGTFGQFTGAAVSGASNNTVVFTAISPYTNVTDLTTGGTAAKAVLGTPVQGSAGTAATAVALAKNTSAKYIANKLSTLAIKQAGSTGNQSYSVALTGGSITMSNNLTYLTPANLGIVNLPITYFTGTRSITGTITAYLKTGLDSTSNLPQSAKMLKGLLDSSATAIDPFFAITVSLGGSTSTTKVDIALPSAMLQIPAINTEQVISTTINFTGQGSTSNAFDITKNNEVSLSYIAAA
jgi:hypothetical protein